MTEILISLSLLLIITVSDLRLMTFYLQLDKQDYYRTIEAVKTLSETEINNVAAIQAFSSAQLPPSSEILRIIAFLSH